MPDMRFAPPPAMRNGSHGGGLNQTSVRTLNERLVMSLLRQHTALSRMELGQHSGLSAQTISVIVRALQRDEFIHAGKAQRGRVGPPSTPMSLNPNGAFAIGAKIGAKSTDTVLIDFTGKVRQHFHLHYTRPDPDDITRHLAESFKAITHELPQKIQDKIVGIGISLPAEMEDWSGVDNGAAEKTSWRDFDFEEAIGSFSPLPVYIQNDVTAAAGAEMIFGAARQWGDFAFIFVGSSTDCRLVLNHHIYAGHRGKSAEPDASSVSLRDLEKALDQANIPSNPLWDKPNEWPDFSGPLEAWVATCGDDLAVTIESVRRFVDIDRVLICGRLPNLILAQICAEVSRNIDAKSEQPTQITQGDMGTFSKAIGAASLPFLSRFMIEEVGLAAN